MQNVHIFQRKLLHNIVMIHVCFLNVLCSPYILSLAQIRIYCFAVHKYISFQQYKENRKIATEDSRNFQFKETILPIRILGSLEPTEQKIPHHHHHHHYPLQCVVIIFGNRTFCLWTHELGRRKPAAEVSVAWSYDAVYGVGTSPAWVLCVLHLPAHLFSPSFMLSIP